MSSRPSVYVIQDTPCDGGKSPNAYVPKITIEIRAFYPPLQKHRVEEALALAYVEAQRKLAAS